MREKLKKNANKTLLIEIENFIKKRLRGKFYMVMFLRVVSTGINDGTTLKVFFFEWLVIFDLE